MQRTILRGLVSVLAVLWSMSAQAGQIAMHFTGSVYGYWSKPIVEDDFPLGTSVSMTLTYDDSFIGQPAGQFFLGMSPAISGTMDLGLNHYTITGMALTYFSYGSTSDDPSPNYGFHVSGTGPATDDGEVFSGMDLHFGLLTLGSPIMLGFGDTNWHVADNGYMLIRGTTTHERLASLVPEPGSLALVVAGLGAWGLARRRPRAVAWA